MAHTFHTRLLFYTISNLYKFRLIFPSYSINLI